MKKMTHLFALAAALSLFACGDDRKVADAAMHDVAPDSAAPPAPALGAQIDRMGRPAINTALNHTFDTTAAKGPAKDLYNHDTAVAGWPAAWVSEFVKNLAIIDGLDASTAVTGGTGCGNQIEYNANLTGGGTAMGGANNSYKTLAGLLANDQLYLDTAKVTCTHYLAVEFGAVTQTGNSTCGGRAPSYDVIDVSYSALALGISGFTQPDLAPKFGDGVAVHSDTSDTGFPFLGNPH
ncbi:MAG: hypothetical protein JWO36_4209 [Myxococcales bacterium]|nr:hypothetical protein [Myxococcales bacterium]